MRIFKKINFTAKQAFFALALIWIISITINFLFEVSQIEEEVYSIALQVARDNYNKDINYRNWFAAEGGVYVKISEYTPPNKYSKIPFRDVETKEGIKLTLVNPAYMTRMVITCKINKMVLKGI